MWPCYRKCGTGGGLLCFKDPDQVIPTLPTDQEEALTASAAPRHACHHASLFYLGEFCLYGYMCIICMLGAPGQKRTSDALEPELQTKVRHCVGADN